MGALHSEATIVPSLKGLSFEEQLQRLELDIEHPEGWFFPDSYRYSRGTTDVELLRKAHRRMVDLLAELWEQRDVGLPRSEEHTSELQSRGHLVCRIVLET